MIQEIIEQMEHRMFIEANADPTGNTAAEKGADGINILQLTKNNLEQYKQTREGRYLCHFDLNDKSKGFIAVHNGKVAGAICVESASDGKKWVQALEVTEEYQNKGLGRQLLKMAMDKLQATHLSVRKSNKYAVHLYLSMGFKAYRDNGFKWLMSTQNMGANLNVVDPIKSKKTPQGPVKESVNPFERFYTESIEFNLNDDDTTINIESFDRGIYNFILVIGLPGSGKGCVGKELAKKYNAKHIELDIFDQCGNMSEYEIRMAGEPFTSYIFNDPNGKWYWKNANTLSINEKLQGNRLFIEYCIAYAKTHRKEIFVIDGTPIYAAMEPEDIQNYPIVIKGTNAKNCFLNKVNRDLNDKSSDKKLHSKVSKDHLSGLLNYYWGDEDALKKFRKDLIEIPGDDINEACKDLATARKFVSEVGELGKKYDTNYFIVTDGASATHNNGNPAVKNARDAQKKWEREHGFDPDEDWSKPSETDESVMEEAFKSKTLYYLSQMNMDGKTLQPQIPDNFLTKHGYEDSTTKRVCFCPTINGCLRALSRNLSHTQWYVHTPSSQNLETYKPSKKEVPDVKLTGEVWVKNPVKVDCVGVIRVIRATNKYSSYKYGSNTAKLYDWKWAWTPTKEDLDYAVRTGLQILKDYPEISKTFKVGDFDGNCELDTEAEYEGYASIYGWSAAIFTFDTGNMYADEYYQIFDRFFNDLKKELNERGIELGCDGDRDNGVVFIYRKGPSKEICLKESTYLEANRSELPDDAFGIPEDRKFPLDTKERVLSAIRLFGHAEESKKKKLAKRIAARAKDYNIKIAETTQVYKYLHMDDQMVTESASKLDPGHKRKKTDKTFKILDQKEPEFDEYLKQNRYCQKFSNYIHNESDSVIIVDTSENKIAGYIFIDTKKYPGFISTLEIVKSYRGYGLSSRLLDYAIAKHKAVDLCVDKDNEIALKLYTDHGFVIIGDGNTKNQYWMKLKSKLSKEERITADKYNSELMTEFVSEEYYRVTYNGIGVYEALRKRVSPIQWKAMLKSDKISWLPKPPEYGDNCRSYFTKEGYARFVSDVLPLITKYLDEDRIKTEQIILTGNPTYMDTYQVVIEK